MELVQKNLFTRVLLSFGGVTLLLLALIRTSAGADFVTLNLFASALCFGIAFLATRFRNNAVIPFLFPVLMLLLYITTNTNAFTEPTQLPTSGLLLFPLYTLFLTGVRWGTVLSAILFTWAISVFMVRGGDVAVFGMATESDFPAVFSLNFLLAFLLEHFRAQLFRKIFKTTYIDALSGLKNRAGFTLDLEKMMAESKPFFLCMTDFDHFSRINANLGIPLSDKLISSMGELIASYGFSHSGRWYGDQFMMLFEGTREECSLELEKLLEAAEKIPGQLELQVLLTFSAGVYEFKGEDVAPDSLIHSVECALAEAKKTYRRGTHFFTPDDLKLRQREVRIENDMLTAIASGQIEVHFQPKVSVVDRSVVGMEALLRWIHPDLGYIIPPEFVTVAERTGTIEALGEYVFERSFDHLKRCQLAGMKTISLSVNVSPAHLLHKDFLAKLLARAEKWRIDPRLVLLEITENVIIQDEVKELLEKIQENDFLLSLDDFGTGYSSLSYLSRFRFDELKIDKSFTDKILTGERDEALFRTIIDLSSQLGMTTVVEGVETDDQRQLIETLGANSIQGWLYSKALPSDQFIMFCDSFAGKMKCEDL